MEMCDTKLDNTVIDTVKLFIKDNVSRIFKYFQLNEIIESPVLLINSLRASVKESKFKTSIITEYVNCFSMTKFTGSRDIEIIEYLIDFAEEGFTFGENIANKNNCDTKIINEITNIGSNSETIVRQSQGVMSDSKGIMRTDTMGEKKSLSKSHVRILSFVVELTANEIIRGINIINSTKEN